MKTSKIGIVFSTLFCLVGIAIAGLASYFTVLYFDRANNHRFEAAYLYDMTFNKSVDVDLGFINPDETIPQQIRLKSVLNKKVRVDFTFDGEPMTLGDYVYVTFEQSEETYLLNNLLTEDTSFNVFLSKKEERTVTFYFYLVNTSDVPMHEEIDFSLNMKAYDL